MAAAALLSPKLALAVERSSADANHTIALAINPTANAKTTRMRDEFLTKTPIDSRKWRTKTPLCSLSAKPGDSVSSARLPWPRGRRARGRAEAMRAQGEMRSARPSAGVCGVGLAPLCEHCGGDEDGRYPEAAEEPSA